MGDGDEGVAAGAEGLDDGGDGLVGVRGVVAAVHVEDDDGAVVGVGEHLVDDAGGGLGEAVGTGDVEADRGDAGWGEFVEGGAVVAAAGEPEPPGGAWVELIEEYYGAVDVVEHGGAGDGSEGVAVLGEAAVIVGVGTQFEERVFRGCGRGTAPSRGR